MFDDDLRRVRADVHEYNELYARCHFPQHGIYIGVVRNRTQIRLNYKGEPVYKDPFMFVIRDGILTNFVTGFDLERGDIRLGHRCCYYNHPANNSKNWHLYVMHMCTDSEFQSDTLFLSEHRFGLGVKKDVLRAIRNAIPEYIKIEMECIWFPRVFKDIPAECEDYPGGTYVNYDIRITRPKGGYAFFGPYHTQLDIYRQKIAKEKYLLEVSTYNKKCAKIRDMIGAKYEAMGKKRDIECLHEIDNAILGIQAPIKPEDLDLPKRYDRVEICEYDPYNNDIIK